MDVCECGDVSLKFGMYSGYAKRTYDVYLYHL